jgi:GT2 family glycosyltransferase/Tfp pilus assembly protein PilF
MIVKNEERFLAQCLRSIVDIADEIIITDTGSTDRTIEIAKSFGATVIESEWRDDFAWARNQSLARATKRWILSLDADEEVTPESKASLVTLKAAPAYRQAVWVRFLNQSDDYKGTGAMSHALIRIFPNDPGIRYRGLIHEYPTYHNDPNGLQGAMANIEIVHHGYMADVVEARNKGARNLALVKAATEREPNDAFHWFNLGTTAFLVEDYELARDALEKMIAVNDGAMRGFMPNGLAVLAEVYCDKLELPEKGEEVCRISLRVAPRYANAHFQLGKALIAQRRFDEAREAYQAAIDDGAYAHLQFVVDDQVYRWKAHSEIGSTYVMQGDDASAAQWFRAGLENAPSVEPLLINLARSLERQKLFEDAAATFRESYETHRTTASTVDYVNFLLRRDRGLEALKIIDEAHGQLEDAGASQLLYAGWQIATKNGIKNARKYLELAAERSPWSAEFLNPLEALYREAGDAAALAAMLEREADSEPRNEADFMRRSFHALGSGDFERALAFAERGLELAPMQPHLHYNAALALGNLGRRAESETHLRHITPRDEAVYPAAELLLAAAARERGDIGEAIAAVSRLLAVQPKNRDGLALRGALEEARGNVSAAEASLRSLFELDRNRGGVELAGFLMRAGRYAEAAQIADRALKTLDFSIVIPVFNKSALTRQCLESLRPTLEGAGAGEVIVIDNASSDDTPQILEAFPWVRVIRNERNLGFAGANNQGARESNGRFLVLLNNDTLSQPGWLASMLEHANDPTVGVVGARLLYPNDRVQHAGVVVVGVPFSKQAFVPMHHNLNVLATDAHANSVHDYQAVTGACLVTPRELYFELGGLDEEFWNGYEDVDYCFKVRERGLRVVCDGDAALYHFESQSGAQRFRKSLWNAEHLIERWAGRVQFDAVTGMLERGMTRHTARGSRGRGDVMVLPIPPTTIVVHGEVPQGERFSFEERLRASMVPITSIVWAVDDAAFDVVQEALRVRGFRYVAFVDARAELTPGWLDELVRQLESSVTTVAASYNPDVPLGENVRMLAPDARCTVLQLKRFPAHVRLRRFASWDAIVADFVLQVLPLGQGTRGCGRRIASLPKIADDPSFEKIHGRTLASLGSDDPVAIEAALTVAPRARPLVSIVTLSWNAPEFTMKALESIARFTSEPYEVIVVDNGSGPQTVSMLNAIEDPHVRVVYNATNRGFAGGNNDGIVAARGEYIVLLNNDVIVTEGWLDGLLWPFTKVPRLGMSAPRSNHVTGDQQIHDSSYPDEDAMHAFAGERRARLRHRGYITDRAIGLCLCIDRRVIEEIGGLDETYGVGNFEDDDLCLRARGAGYQIYVCYDVFIHHFGSQSFKANNVDYMATMRANWSTFARKWGYPSDYPTEGYDPRTAIYAGFDRTCHYTPLPGAR